MKPGEALATYQSNRAETHHLALESSPRRLRTCCQTGPGKARESTLTSYDKPLALYL